MKITVKDARLLKQCCIVLLDGTHPVSTPLNNGQNSVSDLHYVLDDKGRHNLQKNLRLSDDIITDADKEKDGIFKELGGAPGKELSLKNTPETFAEWLRRTNAIEERIESRPMLRVKRSWLKESNDNPIPGSIILTLGKIGEGSVKILDDDTPAAEAADVIPDEEPAPAPKEGSKK